MNFREISSDALPHSNNVFRRRGTVACDWLDDSWALTLVPSRDSREGLFCIHAQWGDAQVILRADWAWITEIAQHVLGEAAITALPGDVMLALLETTFADVSNQIEYYTKQRVRILHCGLEPIQQEGLQAFEWRLESQEKKVQGELLADRRGLESLAAALLSTEESSTEEEWDALPIPLQFQVGWVDIERIAIDSLGKGDVLLLDESWLGEGDSLLVKVDRKFVFRADLSKTEIIVTQSIEEIMADTYDDEIENIQQFDELTVRLTFDLGERSVTLGELKSMGPGYAFDLGRDLRRTVTIRANGKPIGEGELVEISGRIGVSILNFTIPAA